MKAASENMEYEKAAMLRDRIRALERLFEKVEGLIGPPTEDGE